MLNNVSLVGRMTRNPELRYTNSGKATCSFSLAVERDFVDANGNRGVDYINVVAWGKPAETIANMSQQGTEMSVSGRLQSRSYENKNGQKVYVTEVIVASYNLLKNYNAGNQQNGGNYNNRNNHSNQQNNNANNNRQNNNNQNQQGGNFNQNQNNPNYQSQQNNGFQQNGNFGNNGNYQQQNQQQNIDLSNLPFADDNGQFRG